MKVFSSKIPGKSWNLVWKSAGHPAFLKLFSNFVHFCTHFQIFCCFFLPSFILFFFAFSPSFSKNCMHALRTGPARACYIHVWNHEVFLLSYFLQALKVFFSFCFLVQYEILVPNFEKLSTLSKRPPPFSGQKLPTGTKKILLTVPKSILRNNLALWHLPYLELSKTLSWI